MRKIPPEQRKIMAADPFYKECCVKGLITEGLDITCSGKIEWHHVWIYAGSQIGDIWAIVPSCHKHHSRAHYPHIKELFEWISLQRANETDLEKYPKKDWPQIIYYLVRKYEKK